MADGKSHSRYGVAGIAIAAGISGLCIYNNNYELAGGIFVGSILGWLMPPDLDLPQRTYDEHRIINLNPIAGTIWVGFWASYGQVFKHRGISHTPVIGTLTRVFWLFRHMIAYIFVTIILSWTGLLTISDEINLPSISTSILLGIFLGWVFQDFIHLSLDGVLFGLNAPRRKFARERNKIYTALALVVVALLTLAAYNLRGVIKMP